MRFMLTLLSCLLYALPYAALLAGAIWTLRAQSPQTRRRLLAACATAFVLACACAVAIHANPWSADSLFYHKDDAHYDQWGQTIAASWSQGEFLPLSRRELIGSLHTGYYRLVAAVYVIAGHRPPVVLGLNLLACALLPLGLFALGRQFGTEPVAHRAAWIGALYPSFWFFSAFLMRDVWITLFFLAAMTALLSLPGLAAPPDSRWLTPLLFFLAFLFQLFILRFYLALIVAGAWSIYELALGPRKKRAAWITAACAAALLLMRLHPALAHLQDRVVLSILWSIPQHLERLDAVAWQFAAGLIKLFLAPFAWATTGGYTIDYFLWPGQWMLYLLILPWGLWGIIHCVRARQSIAFLLILPCIAAAFGFALAYEGSVPRQRMFLDALLIVLAARASANANARPAGQERFLAAYYTLFALFVAAHITSLFMRGIW